MSMSSGLFRLPENPFFCCDPDGFSVVDGTFMRGPRSILNIEPLMTLCVGPGNVFEQRPRRVVGREGNVVTVECDGGVHVHLDFDELAARRRTAEGESVYLGGLDEGNDAKGWMHWR